MMTGSESPRDGGPARPGVVKEGTGAEGRPARRGPPGPGQAADSGAAASGAGRARTGDGRPATRYILVAPGGHPAARHSPPTRWSTTSGTRSTSTTCPTGACAAQVSSAGRTSRRCSTRRPGCRRWSGTLGLHRGDDRVRHRGGARPGADDAPAVPRRGFLRASVLVPWAMPTVVSAMLWKTMFDPSAGFVDYILGAFHPAWSEHRLAGREPSGGRGRPSSSRTPGRTYRSSAILLLAGLQVIPNDVYEAARMDGASWWQSFTAGDAADAEAGALGGASSSARCRRLLVFDVIYIMTGGGPGNSTESLSFLNYQTFIINTTSAWAGRCPSSWCCSPSPCPSYTSGRSARRPHERG